MRDSSLEDQSLGDLSEISPYLYSAERMDEAAIHRFRERWKRLHGQGQVAIIPSLAPAPFVMRLDEAIAIALTHGHRPALNMDETAARAEAMRTIENARCSAVKRFTDARGGRER